jgi:transmembrane sensor
MKDMNRFNDFMERYMRGAYTETEHLQFLEWFDNLDPEETEQVMEQYGRISARYDRLQTLFPPRPTIHHMIESRLDELDARRYAKTRFIFWKYGVAAALLVLVGTFSYFFIQKHEDIEKVSVKTETNDVIPGSNKAVLTLSDGSDIILDDSKNGKIATQEGITITKTIEGKLIYQTQSTSDNIDYSNGENLNTITTPKAGQFKISLPDGTLVWLNSLSSIRFPAHFNGPVRKVEITGEVYFEVAKLKKVIRGQLTKVPFHVVSSDQIVEVLGTQFNVNSYKDEAITKTTLIEGSVKVLLAPKPGRKNKEVKLMPGEQSQVSAGNKSGKTDKDEISIQNVDSEEAVAWKNGYFRFKDANIKEVMRQLSRWYDIEVTYNGDFSSDQFTGFVSRNIKLSNVLKILQEGGGVQFVVNGKHVQVIKGESI